MQIYPSPDRKRQRLYHGTRVDLKPGDLIAPGYASNYGEQKKATHTGLLSPRSRWRDAGEHEVNKSAHLCGRQTSRSKPQTVFALMPFLIWSMANFGLYTFIAAILRRSLPATVVPLFLLLFGLGAVAGNFMGGVLSDRFGTRKPMITCLTLLICALGGIEFNSASFIAAGVNMIAWAILMAALFTLQQQRAILVDPAQSNLLLALNNSALYLGAAIGSAAFGAVISATSFSFVSPVSAGAAALSLGALLFMPLCDQETPPSAREKVTIRGKMPTIGNKPAGNPPS